LSAQHSQIKTVKAPPDVRRLIEGLRDLGYDCTLAIADLIDNSLAADATEVAVDLHAQQDDRPPYIVIADNGCGMDRRTLHDRMRFGASDEHAAEDLGKYGLGLKTASLSQCRRVTVVTKPRRGKGTRSTMSVATWDLDHVYAENDWSLLAPEIDELQPWEREVVRELFPQHGTLVLWSNMEEALPLLSSHNIRERESFLADLINEVSRHVRVVFHRFLQGSVPHRRKMRMTVCGDALTPWDPFCRNEQTEELDIAKFHVTITKGSLRGKKQQITFAPFVLPAESEFSSSKARDEAGLGNWNQHQGLYFYRNNRLLQQGGWSWLRTPDEHTKLLRVAVDFTGSLDEAFRVNVSKMRARVPAEIRESVKNAITPWAREAKERYNKARSPATTSSQNQSPSAGALKNRPSDRSPVSAISIGKLSLHQSNAPSTALTVAKGAAPGSIRLIIPHQHDFASIFRPSIRGNDAKTLCFAFLSLLEAIVEGRLKPSDVPLSSLRKRAKSLL